MVKHVNRGVYWRYPANQASRPKIYCLNATVETTIDRHKRVDVELMGTCGTVIHHVEALISPQPAFHSLRAVPVLLLIVTIPLLL